MNFNEETARLVRSVKEIYSLQKKYSLASDSFKERVEKINDFRVTAPIVGKFSTGKSSLLNSLLGKNRLGKNYLATALTPETSVPTEIFFDTTEKILVFGKNVT
ncbi:MAG: dynamin family protein, partial [Selenomonadaceae bacterium]|nr:dynamin family protein [Selenomonadaceae bacterium]